MRAWMIALVLAVGCKDKPQQKASPPTVVTRPDAAVPVIDWTQCDAALVKAASAPPTARAQIVLDGCRACGDPNVLIAWSTLPREGGPKREQIEHAMVACNAFCNGDAKLKFMAALDKARDSSSRGPWRQLAMLCKEAFPGDARFMSAPYFLLDRIARAAVAHGGETATHLAALELPLPAFTVSGEGPMLPDQVGPAPAQPGDIQITLLGDTLQVGRLPRAKLTATGVVLELAGYPGEQVKLKELAAALRKLVGDDKTQTITLLAPYAMPAASLVPVIAAASGIAPVYLGVAARESPAGWPLVANIPVALEPRGPLPINVTPDMTVTNLARELGERAAAQQPRVGVTAK